jgi:hypothetical protein
MYWLHLTEFAYNNSVHALIGVMPLFVEKGFHSSIETTVWAIAANRSVSDVPDVKAWAEK